MTTGFDGCCACIPWWASFGGGVVSCYWHPRRWTPHRPTTAAMTVAAAAAECSVVFYSDGGPVKCLTTTSTWKKKSLHRTGHWMMRRTKLSIRTTSDCRLIQRPTWLRYSGSLMWIFYRLLYHFLFFDSRTWRLTGHLKAIRLWLDFPFRVVDSVTSFFLRESEGLKWAIKKRSLNPTSPLPVTLFKL